MIFPDNSGIPVGDVGCPQIGHFSGSRYASEPPASSGYRAGMF